VITPIVLPWPFQRSLEVMARVLLEPGDRSHIDFSRPVGESDPATAQDRACRYGDNLRCPQHGRALSMLPHTYGCAAAAPVYSPNVA
jgi:hypothetical protein